MISDGKNVMWESIDKHFQSETISSDYGCHNSFKTDMKWKGKIETLYIYKNKASKEWRKIWMPWNNNDSWKLFRSCYNFAQITYCEEMKSFTNGKLSLL